MLFKKLALLLTAAVLTSPTLSTQSTPADALRRRTSGQICNAGSYSSSGYAPCTQCSPGKYAPKAGARSCSPCPAGYMCPSSSMHTPQQCSPGRYSTGGATNCALCAAGTFNNIHKATSCCPCPAGWFLAHGGNTNCQLCPNQTPYSSPGCDAMNKCSSRPGSFAPSRTSNQGSDGSCPPSYPMPSAHPKRDWVPRSNCGFGQRACPVYKNGRIIDWNCVDSETDLFSCGGCVEFGGEGAPLGVDTGRDCSTIPFVNDVACVKGKCQIGSCESGYVRTESGCTSPQFTINFD